MDIQERGCREVSRQGVVAAVRGAVADVEILQRSACAGCHVKALCAAGESAVKIVQVTNQGNLRPGMTVRVSLEERIGWIGVAVGFVIPLVLVVTVLFSLTRVVSREEFAGLGAVASLVPYYALVYAFRGFFARIVRFRVSEVDSGEEEQRGGAPFHIVRKEGTS
ncbi:hypothetical protein AU468_08950 [Alkalispirochaeta sphaeroplastigenens]|uniref:Positive regulator of sigma(E), RseC/MucC n=1 Tax=Alkalispirochaeta sphaeroplastigenens TaxID=1187066 RepID=A0A2S4JN82_9SPIO|nr:SoxR reducing system RseC family protein [Alkalispirochaeta sphaeroplastigenens]POR00989.1 hypothetical protein AU468_08950 [Alkalispirochaeta sphaeroplastigenens]